MAKENAVCCKEFFLPKISTKSWTVAESPYQSKPVRRLLDFLFIIGAFCPVQFCQTNTNRLYVSNEISNVNQWVEGVKDITFPSVIVHYDIIGLCAMPSYLKKSITGLEFTGI